MVVRVLIITIVIIRLLGKVTAADVQHFRGVVIVVTTTHQHHIRVAVVFVVLVIPVFIFRIVPTRMMSSTTTVRQVVIIARLLFETLQSGSCALIKCAELLQKLVEHVHSTLLVQRQRHGARQIRRQIARAAVALIHEHLRQFQRMLQVHASASQGVQHCELRVIIVAITIVLPLHHDSIFLLT